MPFEIVRNDITRMHVDAIVNAANNSLLGGGGVDGAIHRAAGPELLKECRGLGGCETGKAKITGAYRLPCRYVIHTVGPVWQGGGHGEEALLRSCYQTSLELAIQRQCKTVAFPLISAGAYGYPKAEALKIAADTIRDFLLDHDMTVFLTVFDRTAFSISAKLYAHIQAFIDDTYVGPQYEEAERRRRSLNVMSLEAQLKRQTDQAAPVKTEKQHTIKPLFREIAKSAPEIETDSEKDAVCQSIASSLEEHLSHLDEGFRDMLLRLIDEKGMTDAECYRKANIDRKVFNKIKNHPQYRPGKPTVVAFAVALELPWTEILDMVTKAGFSLSRSSKFDLIIEYFIRQGNYNILDINEALFAFDQALLGSGMSAN